MVGMVNWAQRCFHLWVAIVGCCPLDKRVGCEVLPVDRLVGRKGGVGTKDMNLPCGIPVEGRSHRREEVLRRRRADLFEVGRRGVIEQVGDKGRRDEVGEMIDYHGGGLGLDGYGQRRRAKDGKQF